MTWKAIRRDRRGVIAIEAGLLAPVFMAIVVMVFDVGVWGIQTNAVQAGLQAGGTYAMQHDSVTPTAIQTVVKNASPMLTRATVTATPSGGNWVITASVPYAGLVFDGLFQMGAISASYTVPVHSS